MCNCAICLRIEQLRKGANPSLIHEFTHSFFVVGDHQYYSGYCLLLYKQHVRELHELNPELQTALNQELMQATSALVKAFSPWKINHCCLGNTDEHIHWHIMPRYESDPDHRKHPWLHSDEFPLHLIDDARKAEIAALIRSNLLINLGKKT